MRTRPSTSPASWTIRTPSAYAHFHAGLLHWWRREPDLALDRAVRVLEIADEYDFRIWAAAGACLEGAAQVALGEVDTGLARVGEGMAAYQGLAAPPVFWPLLQFVSAGASLIGGPSRRRARADRDCHRADDERGRDGQHPRPGDAAAPWRHPGGCRGRRGSRVGCGGGLRGGAGRGRDGSASGCRSSALRPGLPGRRRPSRAPDASTTCGRSTTRSPRGSRPPI